MVTSVMFSGQKPRFGFSVGLASGAAVVCVLAGLACVTPALARGGGHGGLGFHGGFGFHGGGRGEGVMTPAYVLIAVSSVTDAEGFKKTVQDLGTAAATFTGRMAIDADNPTAWEGSAPEHVVMIQFADIDQAQAWKNSEAFTSFDTDLRKSSVSTMQMVQGLPIPVGRGGHGGGRFDAKAFEPNVRDYDRLLDQRLKTICKGC
jgi:uncharacterized protein (DUF1330 family)